VVLCSGWQDKVNIEDTIFGGALADRLLASGKFELAGDAALMALDMWRQQRHRVAAYLERTEHFVRLKANHLEDSVPFCLAPDSTEVVPELVKDGDLLILHNAF
ncbi:MAG: 2-phosphosulfolactate phosphatase, partial [Tannerellaceae bacterium]